MEDPHIYNQQDTEAYRDKISTVDQKGKRVWIFPKKPTGKYYNWRSVVSIVLLVLFFGSPFIKIGDQPLLMFNVLERKYVILGQVFWPQDFPFFVLMMITGVVFIALFTVVFGRVFCGWLCPQTIFMEMVFRKIEYWIEGDYNAQRALDKMPWNGTKIFKRGLKNLVFLFISFLISNLFLAYVIGSDAWMKTITDPPAEHMAGLFGIVVFSFVFYFVFAWMREQVCIAICPYGRLQGVLMDKHSMIVAYDYKRGEERGKFKKGEDRTDAGKGDCIDCHQCVLVCPTGIDIRNGTQLECTNCTACIDVCDNMMEKVGLDKGLIRYASDESIKQGVPFKFTFRMAAYSSVLLILIGVLTFLLLSRPALDISVMRAQGTLYDMRKDTVTNLYNFKILNKTNRKIEWKLISEDKHFIVQRIGEERAMEPNSESEGVFILLRIPDGKPHKVKEELRLNVNGEGKVLESVKTTFVGPIN